MDQVHRLESMNWTNFDQPFAPLWITFDESVHRMKPGPRSLSDPPILDRTLLKRTHPFRAPQGWSVCSKGPTQLAQLPWHESQRKLWASRSGIDTFWPQHAPIWCSRLLYSAEMEFYQLPWEGLIPHLGIKKPSQWLGCWTERVGFEPTVGLHPRWFSRPEP